MKNIGELFASIITLIVGLIELLLGIRFFLVLFGASSSSGFVNWVYRNSAAFVQPFRNIFSNPVINSKYIFEINTLIAIFVIALVGYIIALLFRYIFNMFDEV